MKTLDEITLRQEYIWCWPINYLPFTSDDVNYQITCVLRQSDK